jgi:hypothetical protein
LKRSGTSAYSNDSRSTNAQHHLDVEWLIQHMLLALQEDEGSNYTGPYRINWRWKRNNNPMWKNYH